MTFATGGGPGEGGTAADRIAQRLIRDVMRGHYLPGDRIREQEAADRLGVSRGPVREALQIVEQEGLVETRPWKGARVVLLTMTDVEDLLLMTAALMEVVTGLAVRRATDAELASFAARVEAHATTADPDVPTHEQLNAAFELGGDLLKIARSPRVASNIGRVVRLVYWQHRVLNAADAAWRAHAAETWRELARALQARDVSGSIRAMNAVDRHTRVQVLKIHRDLGSAVYRLFSQA